MICEPKAFLFVRYVLQDISIPAYLYVDYIYTGADVQAQDILTIAGLSDLWGKDMDEPYIAIENLKVSKDMVTIYRKTSNTIKITLQNKISLMIFNATEEDCDKLQNFDTTYISINAVGKCNINQ